MSKLRSREGTPLELLVEAELKPNEKDPKFFHSNTLQRGGGRASLGVVLLFPSLAFAFPFCGMGPMLQPLRAAARDLGTPTGVAMALCNSAFPVCPSCAAHSGPAWAGPDVPGGENEGEQHVQFPALTTNPPSRAVGDS